MTEANALPSAPGKRTRGVSARGLGVTPVSFTRDSESKVPGRRPPSEGSSFVVIEGSLLIVRGSRAGLGNTHWLTRGPDSGLGVNVTIIGIHLIHHITDLISLLDSR